MSFHFSTRNESVESVDVRKCVNYHILKSKPKYVDDEFCACVHITFFLTHVMSVVACAIAHVRKKNITREEESEKESRQK